MKTFRQFLQEADPLEELQVVMFFRKEMGLDSAEGHKATAWFLEPNGQTINAMSGFTWRAIMNYVIKLEPTAKNMATGLKSQFAHDTLRVTMKQKYDIPDLRKPSGW